VAAILSAYDDLIENNKRRIALLEKLAEEIYREWFVRLRCPNHDQLKIVKRVPSEWSFDCASEFFRLVKGKSYTGDEISDNPEHMPFISLKSFNRGGGYREDGLKFYSGRYKDEQLVRQNDVVVALTDMTQDRAIVGRPARIPNLGKRGAVISLDAVRLIPHNINNTFLYAYMRYSGFSDFIKEFANGTNVLHLKPELITKQKIIVPQREIQGKFAFNVSPLYAEADLISDSNKRLVELRNALLTRLISGKLSVENLDIQFPPEMMDKLDQTSVLTNHA
jgi:type I restriction enzyme S subunit